MALVFALALVTRRGGGEVEGVTGGGVMVTTLRHMMRSGGEEERGVSTGRVTVIPDLVLTF